HHPYGDSEIARLREEAARVGAHLITTAKDWVRLAPTSRDGIAVLEVEIRWRDRAAVAHLLADVLRQTPNRTDRRSGQRYERSVSRL
ncbi:MAG: tetraacyldisaccharide 4'-kinase, partial [Stellaceae bacterium]